MFDQTAPPQMSNDGNNSPAGNQNDPQVIQPVDQPVDNFVDQPDNQPVDQVADQLTNQNQAYPSWQSIPSQDSPPSGMTRVPMQDDFSLPQVGDQPVDQINDQVNNTIGNVGVSDPTPIPTSEKLEDQNIFYMLGVTDGTEEQKNQFLDELQQVIWEDFLDEDVKLLLTQEEQTELDKLKATKPDAKLEEQEEVIVYLEKLIPDLEDILLEKALELKADLMKERVTGMQELYKDKPEHLAKIDEAERMIGEEKWLSAAQELNSITSTQSP